ncbi:MAG: hypothetical protein H5T95_12770 [Firmicutes bacterium]|nr:hypothetical protein [Bacillota bacterium]
MDDVINDDIINDDIINDDIINAPTAACCASLQTRHIELKPLGGCAARCARLRTHVAAHSFKFEVGHL